MISSWYYVATHAFFSTKHAEKDGMKFKPGRVVITSIKDGTHLQFARIEEIFVDHSKVVLGLQTLTVIEFSDHYHSWVVTSTPKLSTLFAKDLPSRQVLTLRSVRGTHWNQYFVTLKYAV